MADTAPIAAVVVRNPRRETVEVDDFESGFMAGKSKWCAGYEQIKNDLRMPRVPAGGNRKISGLFVERRHVRLFILLRQYPR
jgi:hypothetical protein